MYLGSLCCLIIHMHRTELCRRALDELVKSFIFHWGGKGFWGRAEHVKNKGNVA